MLRKPKRHDRSCFWRDKYRRQTWTCVQLVDLISLWTPTSSDKNKKGIWIHFDPLNNTHLQPWVHFVVDYLRFYGCRRAEWSLQLNGVRDKIISFKDTLFSNSWHFNQTSQTQHERRQTTWQLRPSKSKPVLKKRGPFQAQPPNTHKAKSSQSQINLKPFSQTTKTQHERLQARHR